MRLSTLAALRRDREQNIFMLTLSPTALAHLAQNFFEDQLHRNYSG
jgi:hypothetical protein